MNNAFIYIFDRLASSESALKNIQKSLRKQSKLNSRFTIFAMATTACLVLLDKSNSKQRKEIKKLSDEIEELKTTKGE